MGRSIRWGLDSLMVIALLVMIAAQPVRADTSAFTFQDPELGSPSGTGNDGFQFQPNVDILVTALGYYDRDQDGLTLTHPVGIFDISSQSLLVMTNVGPGSTLNGLFRYSSIPPLLLPQGHSYMVVGFHPGSQTEDLLAPPVELVSAPEITYQGYFYNFEEILSFPTTSNPIPFFGPNFQFTTVNNTVDNDGDGIPDNEDECPDSDLRATVVINGCNSRVPNPVFPSGCTISDFIAACAEGASDHGQFVRCVFHVTNDLKEAGTITGQQQGAIQSCAAKVHIP